MWIKQMVLAFGLILVLQNPSVAAKKPAPALKETPIKTEETFDQLKGTCQSHKLVPNASSCHGKDGSLGTYHQVGANCICTKAN